MPMTIKFTGEINRATDANYYDYLDKTLLPRRVRDDVKEALESALYMIADGAKEVTVPIRFDGDDVGELTVTEE